MKKNVHAAHGPVAIRGRTAAVTSLSRSTAAREQRMQWDGATLPQRHHGRA